jgi:hypothetical protein
MCTQYLHYIYPPTPFSQLLLSTKWKKNLNSGVNIPPQAFCFIGALSKYSNLIIHSWLGSSDKCLIFHIRSFEIRYYQRNTTHDGMPIGL